MSTAITFPMPDGATYFIPAVDDEDWGQNVTNFLVAIPLGVPPRSGTFALTGDLSFGASFGLISAYFTSIAANPASAGMLRLAKTDAIEWRNNANSGNLALGINSSNQLTFNGSLVPFGTVPVSEGGTGKTSLTAFAVICGGITSTGALQQVAGVGTSGQLLVSNGAGTLPTWQTVSTGSGTVNNGTATQLAFYPASTAVVGGATNLTWDNTNFILTANPGVGGGFVGGFGQFNNTSGGLIIGTNAVIDVTLGTNRHFNIIDPGANSSFVATSASVALTTQGVDIATTPLLTLGGGNGKLFRVSVYLVDESADVTAGAVKATIGWTDNVQAQTVNTATILLTTAGTFTQSVFIIQPNNTTTITYATSHTGIFGTAKYQLYIAVERIS